MKLALNRLAVVLAAVVALGLGGLAWPAAAAEAEFVGMLADVVKDETAKELGLTGEQMAELLALIDKRETEVLEQALQLKDAPAEERQQKLAPFRAESEKLGLAILTAEQREKLAARSGEKPAAQPAAATPGEAPAPGGERRDRRRFNRGGEGERTAPAEGAAPTAPPAERPSGDATLKFAFRHQPWGSVLEWFADNADLSLVMDAPPPGTFNYTDNRDYTAAEAIDLLNGVLQVKGYTLVRRGRMLILINLEDKIPPNLVPYVPLSELDKRSEFELVSVLFPLAKMTPEEAQSEIEKLRGPQGTVVTLPRSGQILVTETAGRLKTIRQVIDSVERPDGGASGQVRQFDVDPSRMQQNLAVVRQLLDISAESNAAADGSLRIAVDTAGGRLLASGRPDKLDRLGEVLKSLGAGGLADSPQLEVYSVGTADTDTALQVLQTILGESPDTRVTADPKTGSIVAFARLSQHATIRATLDNLQRDSRKLEAIRLRFVDPALAVTAINKLFGVDAQNPSPTAPRIDAEPSSRRLLVRGSKAQIDQIKGLLAQMGETTTAAGEDSGRGNLRVLPLTGRTARTAVEQLQQLWPSMGTNPIKVVTPSAVVTRMLQDRGVTASGGTLRVPGTLPPAALPSATLPAATAPAADEADSEPARSEAPAVAPAPQQTPDALEVDRGSDDDSAGPANAYRSAETPVVFAAQVTQRGGEEAAPASDAPAAAPTDAASAAGSSIIIAPGPTGTVIASDDTEALDKLENLLRSISSLKPTGKQEYAVFYLKFARADSVAQTLDQIVTGGGSATGDLAGAAMNAVGGGGFMGGLMGMDGGGDSGAGALGGGLMKIVPDSRLNALLVQAKPAELDMIEEMLKILDQPGSPEDVLVQARPRLIPVFNTSATEIADIVKQVYSEQMVGAGGAGGMPGPQDFFRQMMQNQGGGRGGRGGNRNTAAAGDTAKMSIGIDTRSNSLVVSAPDRLFTEVKELVDTLDHAQTDVEKTIRVVTLKRTKPTALKAALSAIAGPAVTSSTNAANAQAGNQRPNFDPGQRDAFRQQMDMFNSMRGMGGPGGGFGGPGGGFGGRGFGGPGGGFGGPGGGGFGGPGGGGFGGPGGGGRGGQGGGQGGQGGGGRRGG
ncbi:MAG: secretin N-terminal domain-containing protein [Pirellulales bacterium]